jgi:WD40 repeat protein
MDKGVSEPWTHLTVWRASSGEKAFTRDDVYAASEFNNSLFFLNHGQQIGWWGAIGKIYSATSGEELKNAPAQIISNVVTDPGNTAKAVVVVENGMAVQELDGSKSTFLDLQQIRPRGFRLDSSGQAVMIWGAKGDQDVFGVWDTASGQMRFDLEGIVQSCSAAAFSPDGKRLVVQVCDDSQRLLVLDAQTGREQDGVTWTDTPQNAAFGSRNGQTLLAMQNRSEVVSIIDASGGDLLQSINLTGETNALAFDPSGTILAAAGYLIDPSTHYLLPKVDLFDWDSGKSIYSKQWQVGEGSPVAGVAFSQDGEGLLILGDDAWRKVWNWRSDLEIKNVGEKLWATGGNIGVYSTGRWMNVKVTESQVTFSDSWGNSMLSVDNTSNICIDLPVFSISGDRRFLAYYCAPDDPVRVYDLATQQQVAELTGPEPMYGDGFYGTAARLSFSPYGALLAVGGYDGSLYLWNAATGERLMMVDEHSGMEALLFSPDGRYLLTLGGDGVVRLWGL